MSDNIILGIEPLGFQWKTADPFLFCVHHNDSYPAGNEQMGPEGSLDGRRIGQDFAGKDGWNMYHGTTVPGFPHHPHRGFETVTIVRQGFIDHSDSLGAAARFGNGDVQWLTAGRGVNHSEMFPLLDRTGPNPLELFQIWLNLPKADKMVDPYFTMFWADRIPTFVAHDDQGKRTAIDIIAGSLEGHTPLPAPPNSWASRAESDLAIWTISMQPGARYTLPPAKQGSNRSLYFFKGSELRVAGQDIPAYHSVSVRPDVEVTLANGDTQSELLLLQGRAIGEPVVQHGPFVMNTQEEIRQAFAEYQHTRFGGWPWPSDFPVHPREAGRFARHGDGREE